MFNLSVVNIIPDTHKDAINQMLDGDAQENWTAALSELGLSLVEIKHIAIFG